MNSIKKCYILVCKIKLPSQNALLILFSVEKLMFPFRQLNQSKPKAMELTTPLAQVHICGHLVAVFFP